MVVVEVGVVVIGDDCRQAVVVVVVVEMVVEVVENSKGNQSSLFCVKTSLEKTFSRQ